MRSLKLIQQQDIFKIVRDRLKREAIVPYFTMVGIIKNGSIWPRFPTQILYQNATEELRNVCGRSTWHMRQIYGPRCDRRWVPGVTKAQRDSERSKETGKRETNDKRRHPKTYADVIITSFLVVNIITIPPSIS